MLGVFDVRRVADSVDVLLLCPWYSPSPHCSSGPRRVTHLVALPWQLRLCWLAIRGWGSALVRHQVLGLQTSSSPAPWEAGRTSHPRALLSLVQTLLQSACYHFTLLGERRRFGRHTISIRRHFSFFFFSFHIFIFIYEDEADKRKTMGMCVLKQQWEEETTWAQGANVHVA